MKKVFFLASMALATTLFSYTGETSSLQFSLPIDGGRKVSPLINSQNGQGFSIGYLTVTSVDSEGALNPNLDQQNVNQLLKQINQLYLQIYNQYTNGATPAPGAPTYVPNTPTKATTSTPITGCQMRRSAKWRSS